MPAYFADMSNASTVLIKGALERDKPQTYVEMLEKISKKQMVVVVGEEDNADP